MYICTGARAWAVIAFTLRNTLPGRLTAFECRRVVGIGDCTVSAKIVKARNRARSRYRLESLACDLIALDLALMRHSEAVNASFGVCPANRCSRRGPKVLQKKWRPRQRFCTLVLLNQT